MKVVIRYKGGKGSGFHGHPGGKGGKGNPGGSQSIGSTRSLNIRTLEGYKNLRPTVRVPTTQEINNFKGAINSLAPEIQALRPYKENILLVVEKGRAESYGPSVYLDDVYLRGYGQGYGLVSEHEYLHTIVSANNWYISEGLYKGQYKPPYFYRHTDHYGEDIFSKLSEQLVMTLNAFNSDINIWRNNVANIEYYFGGGHTAEDAQTQIDAAGSFLKGIGLW